MTTNLFVIDLTYVAPLEEVDRLVESHRAFLKANYDAGCFLVSGPKDPRIGGVILARGQSCEEIERIIENDPFKRECVADYAVIQFVPVMSADDFPE
ncbi:MAG: YciI family protein [Roseibium sp.]